MKRRDRIYVGVGDSKLIIQLEEKRLELDIKETKIENKEDLFGKYKNRGY